MKPGDLIEWVYKHNNEVVAVEELWSTLTKKWVPIGEKSLLISITDVEYTWLNSKGLFRARRDDVMPESRRLEALVLFRECAHETR